MYASVISFYLLTNALYGIVHQTKAQIQEESLNLDALKTEFAVTDDTLKDWTSEIQQWADTGRHILDYFSTVLIVLTLSVTEL